MEWHLPDGFISRPALVPFRAALHFLYSQSQTPHAARSLGDPDFKGFSPDSHAQPPDDFIFAFPPDHPRSFSADLVLATPDTTRHDLRDGDEYLVRAMYTCAASYETCRHELVDF